jgi:hypothetical protein
MISAASDRFAVPDSAAIESESRPICLPPRFRQTFNPKSPYRVIRSGRFRSLPVVHLAEVQSDLVQAARDRAWEVDFDEITNLNKQAGSSQQSGKPVNRSNLARAIDLLMREMYLAITIFVVQNTGPD